MQTPTRTVDRHQAEAFAATLPPLLVAAERVFEFLDAPIEIEDRPGAQSLEPFASSIAFEGVPVRTTVIIIEESYEGAVARARGFDDRQLEGLLRSALPDVDG